MGKLKDLAIQFANRKKGPQCSVGQLLDTLKTEERVELNEAITSQLPGPAISEAVDQMYGVLLKAHIIGRHRRRECKCPS